MPVYENDCVDCPHEMGCFGKTCLNQDVPHFYCGSCGEEYDEYYEYEGGYFCKDCYISIIVNAANKYTAEEIIEQGG